MGHQSLDRTHTPEGSQDQRGSRTDFDMISVLAINSADAETPFLPASDINNGASSDDDTVSTMVSPGDTITSEAGWTMPKQVLAQIVLQPSNDVKEIDPSPSHFLLSSNHAFGNAGSEFRDPPPNEKPGIRKMAPQVRTYIL